MHERRCVIIKFHNVQQLNMISNASVHVRHVSSLVDKMHIFDRFFGVHCNECKEVITDRVMKAGDRVRIAVWCLPLDVWFTSLPHPRVTTSTASSAASVW